MKNWQRNAEWVRLVKLFYIAVIIASFASCWERFFMDGLDNVGQLSNRILIVCLYGVINISLTRIYNGYSVGMLSSFELIYSQCLANIISAGIIYVVAVVCWLSFPNPMPLILLTVVQCVFSAIWSTLTGRVYNRKHAPKRTIVVCRNRSDIRFVQEVYRSSNEFNVEKTVEYDGEDYRKLLQELDGYETVFVAGIAATLRNAIVKHCVDNNIQAYIVPHIGDVIMAGSKYMSMYSVPVMRVSRVSPKLEYCVIKRLMDIVLSLIAIVLASPFMAVAAIAIKTYDNGPVIYKQVRLTKDGKEFSILKFRSMKVNAEKDGIARLASENDDRITPVGKIIRACRVDELPQLFNILKGDMSIVGPRPERPEIARQYENEMPAFSLRLQVKAGLTGLAQVYGRYNTEPYNKLQMDLMYINNISLLEDIKLILATIKVLFMKESTQGVGKGQVTASNREKSTVDKTSA